MQTLLSTPALQIPTSEGLHCCPSIPTVVHRRCRYGRMAKRSAGVRAAVSPAAVTPRREADPKKRVVITGMGLVSVFGNDVEKYYERLLEGESGVGPIDRFDASVFPTKFAGQIRGFSSEGYIDGKNDRRLDDCLRYCLVSGKKALESAGLALGSAALKKIDKVRAGVLVGTGMGGLTVFSDGVQALIDKGYRKITPFFIPYAITNMGSALLAMDIGFMGANYSISTACATSNYCFHAAANHIRRGDADVMIAGGTEAAIIPIGVGGFIACRALSQRNDEPHTASRPWDKGRDGFVMGEGSGVLVLESLEHAMKRDAPIIAEYLGGAVNCDAYHMTDPRADGLGVSTCIHKSLEDAGVAPEEVNYINAHATSTPVGDLAEVNAIKKVFKNPKDIKMNATKSMIGHCLGASGGLEAIASVKAITTGWLHPPSPPPSNSSIQVPSINPPTSPSPPSSSPTPPSNSPSLPSPNPTGFPASPISPDAGRSSTPSANDNLGPGSGIAVGGGSNTGVIVPIAVVSALVALSLIGISVWFMSKRKKKSGGYAAGFVMPSPMGSSQVSESSYPRSPSAPLVHHSSGTYGGTPGSMTSLPEHSLGNSKSWFSFEELYQITNGFSEQNLLGEGGFGCVYKGCLPDGREVAVKQLKVGGAQGEREFRAEVEIISRVHHRHLVSLVGYCIAENQRLLVYDYVPNNTLHYHLHGQGNSVMDWAVRVKVAAGAARGISYLHEDCHPRIIHRDIKSSNILLDNNFEAQVSDFGLARLAMDAWTHVSTRVMGTFGYLAPEYASTGKLTEKSDVFSFGVVLLELITGRKPVDSSQPLGDESLVEWARPLLSNALESGDFGALPDSRLENNYNMKEMFRMIEAAAACVRHSASMRPRMSLVVRALDILADIDLSNGIQPGQSELFNTGPQSEEIRMFQRMAFGSQNFSTGFTRSSLMSDREL